MRRIHTVVLLAIVNFVIVNGYVSKCVHSGVKCSDCQHLVHCVETPEGMENYQLNFCNNSLGLYCSAKRGICVKDVAACRIFGLEQIECQVEGNFPDPYDCNAYHACIKQNDGAFQSVRHNCPEDRAYDSLTESCRFKPDHEVCRNTPVARCRKPMQTEPLKENKNIYYVCVSNIYYVCVSRNRTIDGENELVHLMYRCRSGEIYSAKNHSCIENEIYNFTCPRQGKFTDIENIRGYWLCNADLTYVRKRCANETYFNFDRKSCLPIPKYNNVD